MAAAVVAPKAPVLGYMVLSAILFLWRLILLQEEELHVRVLDSEINSLEERNDGCERHVGMSLLPPKRVSK